MRVGKIRAPLLLLAALAAAAGCRRPATGGPSAEPSSAAPVEEQLSEQERALAKASTIPETVLVVLKAHGKNLRRLEGMNEDTPVAAFGATIDVDRKRALAVVRSVQERVGPSYFVFISDQNFGIAGLPDNVSLLKTADPYEAMRVMGTNGDNHEIDTDRVIAQLKKWDAAFGLKFHGVGYDWLEAEFVRRPPDMRSFAKDVYKFCPDVVDQGAETVEKLESEMARANKLYLWWD